MKRCNLKIITTFILACCICNIVMAEDLNCMLCHKHFGLVGFNDKGKLQIHYINEQLLKRSPHGNVECINCHEGIDEVPHKDVKAVDCTVECHIDEPSNNQRYSHKSVEKLLRRSIHSRLDENEREKKHVDDYPLCRDCHQQPLYRTLVGITEDHKNITKTSIAKCNTCHEKEEFSEKYFFHVTSRLQRQSNPLVRIETCANCHNNRGILERHEMSDAVSSYKETFHYKVLRLGSEKTPDCIDCHVLSGADGHLIESTKKRSSPTHPDNVGQTCKKSGCHENATTKLAGFQTHVTYELRKYPLQHLLLLFFRVVMTVVLYGFLAIVFLELLRRLLPDPAPPAPRRRSVHQTPAHNRNRQTPQNHRRQL